MRVANLRRRLTRGVRRPHQQTNNKQLPTQQVFNHGALLIRNATVVGRRTKLALVGFTLMMLFAMAVWLFFLYRFDPHAGHASLMTMASVGLPDVDTVFGQP